MDKRFIFRYHQRGAMGGRRRVERASQWIWFVSRGSPCVGGKSPAPKGKGGTKVVLGRLESLSPNCQEKPLSVDVLVPVPQTDTGRWVEDTKAIERTLVKELGKFTP
jgi:hypothetical protein